MGDSIKDKINRTLESQKRRNLSLGIFALIAALVIVCVALVARQPSVAKTTTKTVLDCHYSGNGAHTHNSDCYDENGMLVCPLKERELHTHTDDCYSVNRTLICGLDESEGHVHTDDCYQETRVLTCGKEEVTESHTHGPGCFTTIEVPVEAPEQVLVEDLTKMNADGSEEVVLTVYVKAPEGALPVGTTMRVEPVSTKDVEDKVAEAVKKKAGEDELTVKQVTAVDITFYDADGYEIEPAIPVEVKIISDDLRGTNNPTLVHLDKETEDAEVVDGTALVNRDDEDMTVGNEDALRFESKEFSPYIVVDVEDVKSDGKDDAKKDEDGDEKSEGGDASLPEQVLTGGANGVTVVAKAPEGAFLEGTQMVVDTVKTNDVKDEVDSVVNGEVKQIAAVEISFVDADGKPVEPQAPIDVTMTNKNAPDEGEAVVVQVDGDGKASVVDQTTITADTDKVYFETETSSTYAMVVTTLTKTLLASDGKTYEIAVTFDEAAKIPADAELEAREIVTGTSEENAEYEDYTAKTEEALGVEAGSLNFVRFFDISIVNKSGKEVQPAEGSKLNVDIRLEDKDEDADTQVVHFGEETEVLDASATGTTVSFETTGFSVYAIVTVADVQELDTKTFGLLNTKDGSKPSGIAMMSEAKDGTKLVGKSTTVKVDTVKRDRNVYVAKDSDISMWTFNSAGGDKYYITTTVNGELKYLSISSTAIELVSAAELTDDCKITVTIGTGTKAGKYKFSSSHGALRLNGSVFDRTAANKTDDNVFMNLAEMSNLKEEDFVVYTAEKVSVSGEKDENGDIDFDVKNGDQVILYTRSWNEETLKYDYYAIDYDGMLVKAYESGNTISWVGTKVNTMLWDFTEYYYEGTTTPNNYYELQNSYSGKYLAPQVTGGEFLSDNTIGINLNGRRKNEYYSTILAWDDPYYDYASLMVKDGRLISVPMSRAADFYFAKMEEVASDEGELTQVATIDHKPFGITLKMQDYEDVDTSDNRSRTQKNVLGNTDYVQWKGTPGLLEKNLTGDYPKVKDRDHSLSELYNNTMDVNQQFLLSTYEETGYFEYDSTQNFAHLIYADNDPWIGKDSPSGGTYKKGDFVIYDQLGTSTEKEPSGKETLMHGQFLPYNDLKEGVFSKYTNTRDIHAEELSSLDPRKGEKLYGIKWDSNRSKTAPNYVDHFFGMEMSASFMQSESGLDAWGHDLIFEFSGDDDFWLYVDGMLVLDLGGIHSALDGSINFRTGKVVVNGGTEFVRNTTLRELYKEALVEKYPNKTDAEIEVLLNGYFKDGGTIFHDYSGHTMRMFYMERGAGASNLHMRFNLTPYVQGGVLLEKEVTGSDNVDETFPFQIEYRDESRPDDAFVRWTDASKVTDPKTGQQVRYEPTYEIDGVTYQDVFFVKAGQTIQVELPSEETVYRFVECGVDTETYDQVTANGTELQATGDQATTGTRKDYRIADSTVVGRKKVIFDNHISSNAIKSLLVTKRLWRDYDMTDEIHSGAGVNSDNREFKFRIYIGKENGEYTVYSTGMYHVKNPEGEYCIYQNGGFVSTGETVFDNLDTTIDAGDLNGELKSEQEKATFYTSPGGAADKIKAGYTIEIPGLMDGTPFKIEERDYEVPTGYNLIGYTFTEGAYSATNTGDANFAGEGTISVSKSNQTVSVHNQHGYGLKVNKVWSDADFMNSHDDIYFGVYLDDQLIEGSVRVLKSPNTSITWFFPELASGKTLNDYQVFELELKSSIEVDPETGVVSGFAANDVVRKEIGNTIEVGGESNEHGYSADLTYTVDYDRQTLTDEQISNKVNNRTDTVMNSRPGIKILKTNMSGDPIEGAQFTLSNNPDEEGKKQFTKHFTSNEQGLVVVAYLVAGDEYTLTETKAPYGYRTLSEVETITIKVDANDRVYVNGSDENHKDGYYTITQVENPTATNMPTVTIKNEDFTLRAVKKDSFSGQPIEGVEFALYRQVYESNESHAPRPDYVVLEGYDNLVTGSDGVIPKIVMKNAEHPDGLKAGVYYLREVDAPSAYQPLGYDVRITLSATGEVTLEKAMYSPQNAAWTIGDISAEEANTSFKDGVLTISVYNEPNDPVRIRKYEEGTTNPLAGVSFELYRVNQVNNLAPIEGEEPVASGTTDTDGIFALGGLDANMSYYLFETETLPGYSPLSGPVVISTGDNNTITAIRMGDGVNRPLDCTKVTDDDGREVWEITVYNSSGDTLPSTGGPGTYLLYSLGTLLTAGAAVGLYVRGRRRVAL